jgi:hypothetical protein
VAIPHINAGAGRIWLSKRPAKLYFRGILKMGGPHHKQADKNIKNLQNYNLLDLTGSDF